MVRTLFRAFARDHFLHLLLLVGAALCVLVPVDIRAWPGVIDWRTIITLTGLMMLTKGVETSGYFDRAGRQLVARFSNERAIALFMVFSAAALSTFMTNDVALFIVVPLTITLKKLCGLPASKLIIFEALAVNAGSLLTPIGNPQNIFLWGRSGISFGGFVWQMAPLALLLMVSLMLLCWLSFPAKKMQFTGHAQDSPWHKPLLFTSLGLYVVFLAALELGYPLIGLALVLVGFLLMARRMLAALDWSLLAVFVVMFIDVHLLTRLPWLHHGLEQVGQLPQLGQFLLSVGLSQFISNVPATLLLANYLPPDQLLAWAVNIGGFGLLPGSMANLIAMRLANDRRIWWRFHLYSLPMLVWATATGYLLCILVLR